jgi:hypothetical protein
LAYEFRRLRFLRFWSPVDVRFAAPPIITQEENIPFPLDPGVNVTTHRHFVAAVAGDIDEISYFQVHVGKGKPAMMPFDADHMRHQRIVSSLRLFLAEATEQTREQRLT